MCLNISPICSRSAAAETAINNLAFRKNILNIEMTEIRKQQGFIFLQGSETWNFLSLCESKDISKTNQSNVCFTYPQKLLLFFFSHRSQSRVNVSSQTIFNSLLLTMGKTQQASLLKIVSCQQQSCCQKIEKEHEICDKRMPY